MLARHHGIADFPIGAAVMPLSAIRFHNGGLAIQKLSKEGARIAANRVLNVRFELIELGGIDIDNHFARAAGQLIRGVTRDGEIEAGANGEQQVAVL
jgi:hypothetical protein